MEVERVVKLNKNWEARQDLEKHLKMKDEKIKIKRNELDLERRLLQQHDETLKKKEEDLKKTKLQDEKIQKEFLQVSEIFGNFLINYNLYIEKNLFYFVIVLYFSIKCQFIRKRQIEQRKKDEDIRRQREIYSDKLTTELVKQQLHQETEQAIQAKHVQHLENIQFSEYMDKIRLNKRELGIEQRDFKLENRLTEEIEANAECKRQEKKQQLYAEQRVRDNFASSFYFIHSRIATYTR